MPPKMYSLQPNSIFSFFSLAGMRVCVRCRSHSSSSGSSRMIYTIELSFQSLNRHSILMYSPDRRVRYLPKIFPYRIENEPPSRG